MVASFCYAFYDNHYYILAAIDMMLEMIGDDVVEVQTDEDGDLFLHQHASRTTNV
jgi:hypothetical protein